MDTSNQEAGVTVGKLDRKRLTFYDNCAIIILPCTLGDKGGAFLSSLAELLFL